MAYYREYTTLVDFRLSYLGISETTDDTFLLDMIRQSSDWISKIAHRSFVPKTETRLFDVPKGRELRLDRDLLSLTTLLNGEGTTITATDYILVPAGSSARHSIRLKQTSSVLWLTDSNANSEQVISVTGIWGHTGEADQSYSDSWLDTTNTLNGALNASATSVAYTGTATMKTGWILKVDSEYMYLSSMPIVSSPMTVVRGVNGSVAASHLTGAAISYWNPSAGLQHVCKIGARALQRLRDNPEGETIVVDGVSFATLKDIDQFVAKQLGMLNLIRK